MDTPTKPALSDANTRMPSGAPGDTAWRDGATGPVSVPVARYTDPQHARREAELLWPSIWHYACTLDHLPTPGRDGAPAEEEPLLQDPGPPRPDEVAVARRGGSARRPTPPSPAS